VFAAAYAERLQAEDVRLVHFAPEGTGVDQQMIADWGHLGHAFELDIKRRSIPTEITGRVRELRARSSDPHALINVIIPETVRHERLRHVLHKVRVQRIKAALVREGVVVTNVVHHEGYEALEPVETHPDGIRRVTQGWRHVAVVLVSGVHNATARSLRYGFSLRPDELHCLHVEVDEKEAAETRRDWEAAHPGVPLEVLVSPYRQIARPIHAWVRHVLEERPKTFVTIVIPEFTVRKWWHRALHNQSALTLKATFLFEPSVVVSAVPYKL
jgi:hypothetical protein